MISYLDPSATLSDACVGLPQRSTRRGRGAYVRLHLLSRIHMSKAVVYTGGRLQVL